jgi:hypothetical protein
MMQTTSGTQSHNQPDRDQQMKTGQQHSQQGGSDSSKSSSNVNQNDQRNQNKTGNEAPVKGGQHSQSGGNK